MIPSPRLLFLSFFINSRNQLSFLFYPQLSWCKSLAQNPGSTPAVTLRASTRIFKSINIRTGLTSKNGIKQYILFRLLIFNFFVNILIVAQKANKRSPALHFLIETTNFLPQSLSRETTTFFCPN